MEFLCPDCHKVTRVGKKGVRVLHDNVYIRVPSATRKAQQDEVYLSDDDGSGGGDGGGGGGGGGDDDDDTGTPNTLDAANKRLVLCKF